MDIKEKSTSKPFRSMSKKEQLKLNNFHQKFVRQREKRFEHQHSSPHSVTKKIFQLLGKKTTGNLKKRLGQPVLLLGEEHKNIHKTHEKMFKKKQLRLSELLKLKKSFKPKYSIIPLAKQVIGNQTQLCSFKLDQILRMKKEKIKKSLKKEKENKMKNRSKTNKSKTDKKQKTFVLKLKKKKERKRFYRINFFQK